MTQEVWVSQSTAFNGVKDKSMSLISVDLLFRSSTESNQEDNALPNRPSNKLFRYLQSFFVIDYNRKGSAQSSLYGVVIILVVTISSMPLTLIPQHDVLLYPKYWPETIFAPLAISAFLASNFVFDSYLILDSGNKSPYVMFAKLFLWNSIPRMILQLVIYVIWIYLMNKHPPVPYVGYITHTVGMVTISVGFWLQHSKMERADKSFRKRFSWYLTMRLFRILINTSYNFVAKMFEKVPSNFQVGLAIVLPMMRYLNRLIQHKAANKARGENEESAKFSVSCNVACSHALQLAIVIGSSATNLTSYVICGIDILLNLFACLNIVILHKKKNNNSTQDLKTRLQGLVVKETLELILPISYCIILTISYYGPNTEIMGNIKNDYWQYRKIDDISLVLFKIGLFLAADLVRVILSSLVLKTFCHINFLWEYCRLMAIYWKPIATTIAAYIIGVS